MKTITNKAKQLFSKVIVKDNILYIDIEEDNKVKKLEQLKDYLNNNTALYILSICFGGGDSLNNYTTIAKVEILEGLPF